MIVGHKLVLDTRRPVCSIRNEVVSFYMSVGSGTRCRNHGHHSHCCWIRHTDACYRWCDFDTCFADYQVSANVPRFLLNIFACHSSDL